MNLHAMVAPAIAVVNPTIYGQIKRSTGYTTAADGTRIPTYAVIDNVPMQVQALSNDELRQLEGLNLQGNKEAVYLYGQYAGLVRVNQQGGDLLLFSGNTWLAVTVLENWPDWTKLAVVMQNE